ncbi:MAG: histidinol dehydrogenase [Gammaproteobacteria bacterium]|nr:histidinol dehydrogenase [Gammaproteobacteria bacterium]
MSTSFPRILSTGTPGFEGEFQALIDGRAQDSRPEQAEAVAAIIEEIRTRGDNALLEYTQRYDGHEAGSVASLLWLATDFQAAFEALDEPLRDALQAAADRIRDYAQRQKLESFEFEDEHGSRLGQRVNALQRVGVYVPGGTAAYPSSVLMNAIPARVAGVEEILMVSPTPDGQVNPVVLAAAHVAGIDRGWALGGAQAVAALALGTETIPAVDKIVGPGNLWVAEAKRQVFGRVGIDMMAGPSEVVIVSDGSADPRWLAADLMAQAEHDEQAQAILLSPDLEHINAVADALAAQLEELPRAKIIRESLATNGALIQTDDLDQAAELVDRLAPEHLQLALKEPDAVMDQIHHAGAIFLGVHSPEVMGDYCAGPNHVLPTMRASRFTSPLGVYDFQKRSSTIRLSQAGAADLAGLAECLAKAEGLGAHAASARWRSDSN